MVLGVPIPEKHSSLLGVDIERVIKQEIQNVDIRKNVAGSQITPYLLERIRVQTKGKSLDANIALIKHNAKIGAEIASQLM
jgi:pseudouridine-5'-phosphate glycosidase